MSKKKKKSPNQKKITRFKIWCMKNGITQRQIHRDTLLSIGTIQSMWMKGNANGSTIKLISLVYNLDENEAKNLITTFE